MSARLPFTISNQSLTFFVKGKPYSLTREHESFIAAKNLLQQPGSHPVQQLVDMVDQRQALLRDSHGALQIIGADLVFRGQVLTGLWVDKIKQFRAAGEPFTALFNALGSLVQNPTPSAIDRLPVFLEKSNLGFLEDGRFIAYKAVNQDYFDCHTGKTFRNMIGDTPQMPRDEVDSNPNACCSTGLHVGTPSYVKDHYGSSANRVMLIAVWPHDVVAVPYSYEGTKMRICAYEVIDELDEVYAGTILGRPVITPRTQLPAVEAASAVPTAEPEPNQAIGSVVHYVETGADLYGVLVDVDTVRNINGNPVDPEEIVRVLEPGEITAACYVVEGALIRVEGDRLLQDGAYKVIGYSEDDDDTQLDSDSRFWRVEVDGVDGGVPVGNASIVTVNPLGEHLWPRSDDAEDDGAEDEAVATGILPEEIRDAAGNAPARPVVGDRIEVLLGGWPPAGIYPVIDVCPTCVVVQTEHDGLVAVNDGQIGTIFRA